MPIPSNPVFPSLPGVSFPVVRTAIGRRMRQEAISGAETVSSAWTYARYRYALTYDFLRQAAAFGEIQTLIGFYNQMILSSDVFLYDDPNDDTAPTDQGFGTGDGVTTAFQLVRTFGGFVEPVFAVNAITNIKAAGTIQSGGSYSVSNKGVVTFNSAPANGAALAWNGTFMWFCRFDDDSIDFQQFTSAADFQGPIWLASKLSFTTVKFGA